MLDSPNLPSQADLNSLYGDWSLSGAMQGHQNQALADQFRQQAYQSNNNSLDKGALENQQSALMNPLLLDQQRGVNAGRDITNASSGLDLASKQDAYQDKQSLLHKTLAREMSDEDLTSESNTYIKKYQQAMLSGNQDEADKYKNVLDTLVGAATAKAADRVSSRNVAELNNSRSLLENQATNRTNLEIAGGHNEATKYGADATERARIMQANLHQQLANEAIQTIKRMKLSPQEELSRIMQVMQTANPGYGAAVSLPALQQGKLRRNADGSEADGSAEKPYKLD